MIVAHARRGGVARGARRELCGFSLTANHTISRGPETRSVASANTRRRDESRLRRTRLLAGGTAGNQQLTAATAVVLLVLLAALGVTIVRIGGLLNPHMFLGMLLVGPVALKLASTGYRFVNATTRPTLATGPAPRRRCG